MHFDIFMRLTRSDETFIIVESSIISFIMRESLRMVCMCYSNFSWNPFFLPLFSDTDIFPSTYVLHVLDFCVLAALIRKENFLTTCREFFVHKLLVQPDGRPCYISTIALQVSGSWQKKVLRKIRPYSCIRQLIQVIFLPT